MCIPICCVSHRRLDVARGGRPCPLHVLRLRLLQPAPAGGRAPPRRGTTPPRATRAATGSHGGSGPKRSTAVVVRRGGEGAVVVVGAVALQAEGGARRDAGKRGVESRRARGRACIGRGRHAESNSSCTGGPSKAAPVAAGHRCACSRCRASMSHISREDVHIIERKAGAAADAQARRLHKDRRRGGDDSGVGAQQPPPRVGDRREDALTEQLVVDDLAHEEIGGRDATARARCSSSCGR